MRTRGVILLAHFYFLFMAPSYSVQVGPFQTSQECNAMRNWVADHKVWGLSISGCWQVNLP